ncbi:MAG: CDP-diacylglycerol--serine O-phosphatidyltransferase [Xanthomonadales bacterium]|nr:CDP-diacylglycerol--serine O-phosphatidyltransferase [Xanthomonadales bacterium]
MSEPSNTNKPSRGVYLLPNLMTTAALFAGYYSIVAGINGHFEKAAIAILLAGIFDGLDGRIARMTNTQSEFGVQYDSLSDLISFGLAPSLLAYNWSLASLHEISPFMGKLGWLAAFIYTACAALRLARFNTQVGVADKAYFQGLASPAAAGTMAAIVWFGVDKGIPSDSLTWPMLVITPLLGLLMFSRIRYFSFKSGPAGDRVPILWIFILMLLLVLLAIDPPTVLLVVGLVYIASGFVFTLMGKQRHRKRKEGAQKHSREADIDEQ